LLEFTMSRVSVFICGAILLSLVIIPVSGIYGEKEDIGMTDMTDTVTNMMDSFWGSEVDVMTIRGWDILPSPNASLSIQGHIVTIHKDGRSYRGMIEHAANDITLSYNQILKVERGGEELVLSHQ
jgi:hypothetical protein